MGGVKGVELFALKAHCTGLISKTRVAKFEKHGVNNLLIV